MLPVRFVSNVVVFFFIFALPQWADLSASGSSAPVVPFHRTQLPWESGYGRSALHARIRSGRNSHSSVYERKEIHTRHFWFLLAGLQLLPPLMSEGDANDVWMQKLKPIYLYVFIYFFLFVLRVQQDHTPRSKFTLIQHCWYWYFKNDLKMICVQCTASSFG